MSIIYGPNNRPVAGPAMQAVKKKALEAWIGVALAGDAALGRSAANFSQDPKESIKPFLKRLQSMGIVVYHGSGQVLLADLKPKNPIVRQRRPLAERRVVIVLGE